VRGPGAPSEDGPVWSPDGRHIAVRVAATSHKTSSIATDSDRVAGSSVVIYRSAPAGGDTTETVPATDDLLGDLALVDVEMGQARVLAKEIRSECYLFAPDGRSIAMLNETRQIRAGRSEMPQYGSLFTLEIITVATGQRRVLVSDVRQTDGTSLSWSPDGTRLAYLSGTTAVPDDGIEGMYSLRGDLYIVNANGGTAVQLQGAPDHAFDGQLFGIAPLWDSESKHVYLADGHRVWRGDVAAGELHPLTSTSTRRVRQIVELTPGGRIWSPDSGGSITIITIDSVTDRSGVYRVTLANGAMSKLREDDQSYSYYVPVGSRDGRVVLLAESVRESQDLWTASGDFGDLHRLTTLNPRIAGLELGASRLIDFQSATGEPLQAALLLPTHYVPGKRYPLLVNVYATILCGERVNQFGMTGAASENLQLFSTRGYAVLCPDIPVHEGTLARDIENAVLPAVDRVIALGIADPDRLAVFGTSNGGYTTLVLLTQTTRFKAGIMSAGFGNPMALYGFMSPNGDAPGMPLFEKVYDRIGGPPWEFPQRWVDNSPIFVIDRIRTPLLIEDGSADNAIVAGSDEVFVDARRAGRDVTYLRYGGEGHFLTQVSNQVDFWNRVFAFLKAHLM
jgi:dipeptidyl aminopeptidase/acylaminoacyl peptidase